MNVRYLSGPLVREIMNVILLEASHRVAKHLHPGRGRPSLMPT